MTYPKTERKLMELNQCDELVGNFLLNWELDWAFSVTISHMENFYIKIDRLKNYWENHFRKNNPLRLDSINFVT